MWVSRLRLDAFRNHTATDIPLTQGVTVFVGDNGQGKTNIVESLGYLSTLTSHRVSSDDALVMMGHPRATVHANVYAGSRSVDLMMTINAQGSNKAQVNNQPATLGEAASWVTTVFFSPEDLPIVRSDPNYRRRFLDSVIVQSTPRMASVFAEYDKVVKQRNMLLKSLRSSRTTPDALSTMAVWDDMLVTLSTEITRFRWKILKDLAPLFSSAYDDIRPGHAVTLSLKHSHDTLQALSPDMTDDEIATTYRDALASVSSHERDRAMTLIGPHRDDVVIELNGLPARTHSSQGEAWSTALALKLATARFYRQTSSYGDPIIILDDVFSELDDTRRHALAKAVAGWEQVLITAAVKTDVPSLLDGRIIGVEGGRIVA